MIEESELLPAGSLKVLGPSLDHVPRDDSRVRRACPITGLQAPQQLVARHIQIAQFDGSTEQASTQPQLIAFSSSPETELQDHSLAETQKAVRVLPEKTFQPVTRVRLVEIDAQPRQPLIRAQANGGQLVGQTLGQRRLSRPRQPAQQDQSPWPVPFHPTSFGGRATGRN